MPAIFGSLTIPIVYQIMKECGFPVVVCTLSAALVCFGTWLYISCFGGPNDLSVDNGHIAQTRLILLDAALIFFMALALYSYVRFRKVRYKYVSNISGSVTSLIFTQRILYRVVGLDVHDRCLPCMYLGLQDGWSLHVLHRWNGRFGRHVGYLRYSKTLSNGKGHRTLLLWISHNYRIL